MSNEDHELSDDVLLEICRVSRDQTDFSEELLADLRAVSRLVGKGPSPRGTQLPHAVSLMTAAVAKLPQFNPKHLPFGYDGPTIRSHGWIEREALERLAKQIVGLQWADTQPDAVANEVASAVSEAVKLGFLDEKDYDAWQPGMASGSGWRSALSATPYGVTKARSACNGAGGKPKVAPIKKAPLFYLVASPSASPTLNCGTVFYKVGDAAIAESLCRLFTKEYGSNGEHHFGAASGADLPPEDHILLDEAMDELQIYDDPDPGVYDPPPTREMMNRAQFARRAATWETMIQGRPSPDQQASGPARQQNSPAQGSETKNQAPDPTAVKANPQSAAKVRALVSSLTELRLAAGELLEVAGKADLYPESQIKAYHEALQRTTPLVDGISQHLNYGRDDAGRVETEIREYLHSLGKAMEHIASDYNDRSGAYPLGKDVTQPGWAALNDAMTIEMALLMTTLDPAEMQMPPAEWRVAGLVLLMLLAQAYYKMLEATISMASWCAALDLELNQSYLWVTTNLANLLKNHEELKDLPAKFEPPFPDLYPSTIRDVEWDDMVAPDAERFLSTVQKYVHAKGVYEPTKGSPAWTFVEMFRPGVEKAIERAAAYNKRMRQYAQWTFGGTSAQARPQGVETNDNLKAVTPPSESRAPASEPQANRYEWARQAELVKATNQVLGDGELNPGVLSRACKAGEITTNQQSGRGAMVDVKSFIAWLGKKRGLDKVELDQVRNAIMGEISERK